MDRLFRASFKGRTVLVTGHTGFKGGWLSLWLEALGARVAGFSLPPPTDPNFFEAVGLAKGLTHREGDVRDAARLSQAVAEIAPDFVFHLAAQPLVRRSYGEPRLTFETNIMGTVNLLEAVRRAACVRACVVITSDKCYENREWPHGYREADPMGGHDPYSASKGCAELVVSSYRRSYFLSHGNGRNRTGLSSARAGNVFGGGDWAQDRLIPDCVRALASGNEVLVRNPGAVRPWQHVLEPLAGYLWLAARMAAKGEEFSGAWNFGPVSRDQVRVSRLVDTFCKCWGKGTWRTPEEGGDADGGLHEADYLALDWNKAHRLLGWHPIRPLEDSLRETAEWYRAFYGEGSKDMRALTLGQIERYVAGARAAKAAWAAGEA